MLVATVPVGVDGSFVATAPPAAAYRAVAVEAGNALPASALATG
jgi:hypothetical protein